MRRIIVQIGIVTALALAWVGTAAAQNEIDVIINDVEVTPLEGGNGYDVTAYVTVADAEEQPITSLTLDDFTLSQDGEETMLQSATIVQRSATIILALDTSGSMSATATIAAVRNAASSFITSLGSQDQVGIIYFNDEIVVAQSLSDDLLAAETIVDLVEAEPGSGTCLYDAAYDAVAMASAAPLGQRAVVLLTDGVDELPNNAGLCSTHTLEDVTDLAADGGIHVPIYTIGLGSQIDASELSRIAERTGGDALIAPGPADIDALFQTVAAQLRNQYALVYETETTSGEHTLTVIASTGGVTGVGTGRFITPIQLSLTGLDEGALLEGSRTVRATASGEATITHVRFVIDGQTTHETIAPPFEITLDSDTLQPGAHSLTVTALLDDGSELTRSLDFEVPAAPGVVPEEPSAAGSEGAPESAAAPLRPWVRPIAIGGGVLLAAGLLGVILFVVSRRKSQEASRTRLAPDDEVTLYDVALADESATGIRPMGLPATLSVAQSATMRPGQSFELTRSLTRLGRSRMNDIIVSDPSVSRRHAEIRYENGEFWVYDLSSSFGTFLNSDRIGVEGHRLQNGDRLRLGPETTLIIHLPPGRDAEDMPTHIGPITKPEDSPDDTERWSGESAEWKG